MTQLKAAQHMQPHAQRERCCISRRSLHVGQKRGCIAQAVPTPLQPGPALAQCWPGKTCAVRLHRRWSCKRCRALLSGYLALHFSNATHASLMAGNALGEVRADNLGATG